MPTDEIEYGKHYNVMYSRKKPVTALDLLTEESNEITNFLTHFLIWTYTSSLHDLFRYLMSIFHFNHLLYFNFIACKTGRLDPLVFLSDAILSRLPLPKCKNGRNYKIITFRLFSIFRWNVKTVHELLNYTNFRKYIFEIVQNVSLGGSTSWHFYTEAVFSGSWEKKLEFQCAASVHTTHSHSKDKWQTVKDWGCVCLSRSRYFFSLILTY